MRLVAVGRCPLLKMSIIIALPFHSEGGLETMPIFAFKCQGCSHKFDLLVHASTIPTCPECQSNKLEKQLTGFAVGGTDGGMDFSGGPGSCGSCGDPRGPGACSMN